MRSEYDRPTSDTNPYPLPGTLARNGGTFLDEAHKASLKFYRAIRGLGFTFPRQYYASPHWTRILAAYPECGLPQVCLGCGRGYRRLLRRTPDRVGRELLLDFLPLCGFCYANFRDYARKYRCRFEHAHYVLQRMFFWSDKETIEYFRPYSNLGSVDGFDWTGYPVLADPEQEEKRLRMAAMPKVEPGPGVLTRSVPRGVSMSIPRNPRRDYLEKRTSLVKMGWDGYAQAN